ncbi:CaiB/BaiF CoA transferase family protein [Lacrimispora indolis]|uniref:CaiB/BaiF CoA transferase family protein n=1 Tax=Lacrimispora indolis TaxID=69825 RepID=UPI00045E65E1|nr:CoA transferase [Lacrimispora indolis]
MKPLEGVKVVDLTTYLAAPTTVRVLGEWGADCIKIESAKGDPARTQGAVFNMPYEDDENLAFDVANMNKRFITLDLRSEKGIEIAYKLLEEADVFVTNTRTKSLKKLGLDYDTLKEKFPRLIFAQVLGYGENGPEKDTAGFDVTCYMARGGVFGTTVNRGDAPMIPTNGFGDFQVALGLASGICAALYAREKSGEGDKVTVGLHHSAVYALSTGVISAQYGNQYPKSRKEVPNPFNNVYRTSDQKWVVICCPEYDRDYEKIMTLLGRADMVGNERYMKCAQVNADNLNHEVIDILDEAIGTFTRKELLAMFKENDLACEAAYEPLDMYDDEQVWANNIIAKIPYPSGERCMPTNPVNFSSLGVPEYHIGGSQGAHTVEILKHLDYANGEIEEILASGAATGETKLKKL